MQTWIKVPLRAALSLLALSAIACSFPSIEILSPQPLRLHQRVKPVAIEFAFDGCEDFSLAIAHHDSLSHASGGIEWALEVEALGAGRYRTEVPVKWLRGDGANLSTNSCAPVSPEPELLARCEGGLLGPASSGPLRLSIALADEQRRHSAGANAVYPGEEQGSFFSIGGGLITASGGTRWTRSLTIPLDPGVRPRFAQQGDRGYVWVGCPLPDCGSSPLSGSNRSNALMVIGPLIAGEPQPLTAPATLIYPLDINPGRLGYLDGGQALKVIGDVTDMSFTAAGDLVVLSSTQLLGHNLTAVTVFEDDGPPSVTLFNGKQAAGELRLSSSGELAFVAWSWEDPWGFSRCSVADRSCTPLDAPGDCPVVAASLAPDAERWALFRGDGTAWVGAHATAPTLLQTQQEKLAECTFTGLQRPGPTIGWTDSGVVLSYYRTSADDQVHSGTSSHGLVTPRGVYLIQERRLELFDLSPPHARRYSSIIDATDPMAADLTPRRVTGAGDNVLLSHHHGIQIIDRYGELRGGLDPLPCGAVLSSAAPAINGDTAMVASGTTLYLFELPR